MIKAAIFDLDDTLFCERDYVISGCNAVAEYAAKGDGQKLAKYRRAFGELIGESVYGVIDRFCARFEGERLNKAELLEAYRNHKPHIALYADVVPCLERLKSRCVKLALLTDGRPFGQRAKIEALGIGKYFKVIVVTDELGGAEFRKPDRRAYELICSRLGVNIEDALVIGDNPAKDFAIGAVGAVTVRVDRGGTYAGCEYYGGIKEKYTVATLAELDGIG